MQAVLFLLIFESHQLDTFCDFDDTFLPAYEIPLILPADTMIGLLPIISIITVRRNHIGPIPVIMRSFGRS